MKNRPRGGLGRGLGALIPTGPVEPAESTTDPLGLVDQPSGGSPVRDEVGIASASPAVPAKSYVEPVSQLAPVPGARFAEIPVEAIVPNPKQPRQIFEDEALEELKVSIEEVGFLQPIVVRELDGGEQFELVMGERRWRAAQAVGREKIPAIIRDTRDDAMLRDALLENIHRANLNPLEEAAAYQQLLDEFGVTHEELARRIGRSRPQISNTIRLMNLPPQVQSRVAAGVLSAGHARALLGLDDAAAQEKLALRIVAEGLSVRSTEELVKLAGMEETPTNTTPAKRRPKPHAPGLTELAERLSDRFDTRVKVDLGRNKGKITIEFASVDDLERIVEIIGTEEQESIVT
ncbi:ParB/RepB/Spo0J family partition protein [Micromonospora polyrhachis]|uniref:ParB family chromosome partitioning protein n=1 Tax=Micromonospora polyrhachis TaxID=1282883 RepID=A0A7W7WQ57_9ACTN|nr:ParB/RepB/Spo0J family partition protein [Micromonospora polyrhachis]MBB4959132.1 ParB family chromosome partitioning protein [Micromonospora polyrhachis]